ncbi:MAG: hypothetical protein KBB88_03370 [Candidatus Pacebacteria bacterium]|nr:hypothetical protein [Candidatus Paceibacterota bacterium]
MTTNNQQSQTRPGLTKKQKCLYCGNNPVNHRVTYFLEWIGGVLSPYENSITNSWFGRTGWKLAISMERFFFRCFTFIGIGRWNTDSKLIVLDRGRVMFEEAQRRGIPIQSFIIYGKPIDTYKAYINGTWMIFQGLPRKEMEIQTVWIDDKAILKKKLLESKIPAPRGGSVRTLEKAMSLFNTLQKPVITKPRSGSRGRHTTTMINTASELTEAFRIAQMISPEVVIEEHIFGSVYRGTVVGGELVGVLAGDPPRVVGDGVSTIFELIKKKNTDLNPAIHEYKITSLTHNFLARSNYTVHDVLPKDTILDLSEKIGTSYGGSSTELFDTAHPKIKEYLTRAGTVVNDNLIGFDFIIPDPLSDPDTQKWGIIECNSLPFINLHHAPVHGTPRNVAKYVWDLWEK